MSTDARNGELLVRLRNRKSLPPLNPEHVWHPGLDAEIANLSEIELAGDRADGYTSAQAWKAVLHLWNDSLEKAHDLVQDLDMPIGSALHGILHRREGDYDNAKYWFRMAGDHSAWHGLQSRAAERLGEIRAAGQMPAGRIGEAIAAMEQQGIWNPYLFTDAVAMVAGTVGQDGVEAILEEIQQLELEAFLKYLDSRID